MSFDIIRKGNCSSMELLQLIAYNIVVICKILHQILTTLQVQNQFIWFFCYGFVISVAIYNLYLEGKLVNGDIPGIAAMESEYFVRDLIYTQVVLLFVYALVSGKRFYLLPLLILNNFKIVMQLTRGNHRNCDCEHRLINVIMKCLVIFVGFYIFLHLNKDKTILIVLFKSLGNRNRQFENQTIDG